MFKAAPRSKAGMPAQQPAGGLHRIRVTLRHLYTGISDVPIEAILYIGDELGRFEKAHVRLDASPLPDLFLMASKSAAVKGVAGWSADSSSQDSSAENVVHQFTRILARPVTHLLLQEILDISGQSDGHQPIFGQPQSLVKHSGPSSSCNLFNSFNLFNLFNSCNPCNTFAPHSTNISVSVT